MDAWMHRFDAWMNGCSFILGSLWVPDHDVCISSWDDPAFPGVEVVDLGCVGAGHRHKAILIHLPSDLQTTATNSNTRTYDGRDNI